ncbi:hypothetical protein V2J09_013534, partial [Rumex salicifolius]
NRFTPVQLTRFGLDHSNSVDLHGCTARDDVRINFTPSCPPPTVITLLFFLNHRRRWKHWLRWRRLHEQPGLEIVVCGMKLASRSGVYKPRSGFNREITALFSSYLREKRQGKNSNPVRAFELGNFLLTASVAKSLSDSGTSNLNVDSFPLTEELVLSLLQKDSLDPSKKLEFFKWCSLRPDYKHTSTTYSHIFRVLFRSRNPSYLRHNEVLSLLDSMNEDGVVVDSDIFKLLLDGFARSGQDDSILELMDRMEKLGVSLSLHMYNSFTVALVRMNKVDSALKMFNNLLDTSNGDDAEFPCEAVTCNEMLVALRKADKRKEFGKVFSRLREKSYVFDSWGYNICIHSFGCWGDLETSLRLFKEMKDQSSGSHSFSDPDLCTYNSLLHVLCLAGKVKDALIIYEELKVSGHEPDAFTYRIVIQGCCKSYRIDDATKTFNEMQYHGFQPDTVIYNSLLDGFLKARRLTEACQLFEKMTQDGIRASCWTYNILIDGLIKNGRALAAYTMFHDLKKKGKFVDGVTYSIVIVHLCKEGQLDEALKMVAEMEVRGFAVDLVTITSLLIRVYKHGRWESMDTLVRYIRDGRVLPIVLKWKFDMEALLKNPQSAKKDLTPFFPSKGSFAQMLNSLKSSDLMSDNGNGSSDVETEHSIADEWSSSPHADELANQPRPDSRIFSGFSLLQGQRVQGKEMNSLDIDMVNTYLSIFLAKGKMSLACKLFEIFSDMGLDFKTYTYNSIMSSFVKKGYYNEAWSIIDHLGESFCPADIATYSIIVQSLGKMGKADLATSVLNKLMEEGGYLDIVMYNTLINALGKAGRIDEANKLFEQMKSSGINPDVVTFNVLIEVHTRTGRLKEAYKFLRMMLDAGCLPNHVTDTTLDYLGKEIEKVRYKRASIKWTKDDDNDDDEEEDNNNGSS